jgi:hypothetical protein
MPTPGSWLYKLYVLLGIITPPPPLWQPVYQSGSDLVVHDENGGVEPLDPQYFLSLDSAQYLAQLYNASVKAEPYEGAGGPEASSAIEYHLVWSDGLDINAGALAYYYKPCGPVGDSNGSDPSLQPGTPYSGVSSPATVENPSLAVTECNALITASRNSMVRKARKGLARKAA